MDDLPQAVTADIEELELLFSADESEGRVDKKQCWENVANPLKPGNIIS